MKGAGRLLRALAGNDLDGAILDETATLAHPNDAEVVLLSVAHYHSRDGRSVAVERGAQIVAAAREYLAERGLRVRTVVGHGEVADVIARQAALRAADLIVMGARGHGSLRRRLEGSIPDRVWRRSSVPVLLVRGSRHGHVAKPAA